MGEGQKAVEDLGAGRGSFRNVGAVTDLRHPGHRCVPFVRRGAEVSSQTLLALQSRGLRINHREVMVRKAVTVLPNGPWSRL